MPSFDLLLIFGVLALAIGSGLIVLFNPNLFGIVLFLDLWFLGYHHVIATFTKLAGTPEDRKDNRFLIYYLPPIVLAVTALISVTAGIWLVVTIYLFWQWYHYTRQSYGIASFYRRKAIRPVIEDPRFAQAVLWSIPVWGILNRCNQGWDKFLGVPVWLPPVPSEVVFIAAFVSCILVTVWIGIRVLAWLRGSLPLGQTLYIMSHFTAFFVGYIAIRDINSGWLVANIWHNTQYILFVWLYNTNRFRKDAVPGTNLISWASQSGPVQVMMYFAGCLIITTLFYGSLTVGYKTFIGHNAALLALLYIVTFQTVNFHHYIVDSLIWKARKKKNQDVMGLINT